MVVIRQKPLRRRNVETKKIRIQNPGFSSLTLKKWKTKDVKKFKLLKGLRFASKLKSNLNYYYPPEESKRLTRLWISFNKIQKPSDWEKILDLKDPKLMLFKFVSCLDACSSITNSINSLSALENVSLFLNEVIKTVFESHKSIIIKKFTTSDFLILLQSILSEPLAVQKSSFGKNFIVLDNFIAFFKHVIAFYRNLPDSSFEPQLLQFITDFTFKFDHSADIVHKLNDISNDLCQEELLPISKCYPNKIFEKENCPKNVVHGPYHSIEQYVSTHFQLMKEDFDLPLRTGLNKYLKDKTITHKQDNKEIPMYRKHNSDTRKQHYEEISVYRNVKLSLNFKNAQQTIFTVLFHIITNKIWKRNISDSFLTGSLLVFTNDDFETYFLAKVDRRRQIHEGRCWLDISFISLPPLIETTCIFDTMIEPHAFFEPYFSVLQALRIKNNFSFPFQKYIVEAQKEIDKPQYLKNKTTVYDIFGHKVDMTTNVDYPSAESLNLNESQLNCLMMALTHELAIVQGPPGTGKTFMCRKIIQTLLQNKKAWTTDHNTPILVICYKNLSLDELLNGLIENDVKVVRIGCGTKSEELATYHNLRYMERPMYCGIINTNINNINMLLYNIQEEMSVCLEAIKLIRKRKGLLDLTMLEQVLLPHQKEFLKNSYISWLGVTNYSLDRELFGVESPQLFPKSNSSNWILRARMPRYYFTIDYIFFKLVQLKNYYKRFIADSQSEDTDDYKEAKEKVEKILIAWDVYQTIKWNLKNKLTVLPKPTPEIGNENLNEIEKLKDRWDIYNSWLSRLWQLNHEKLSQLVPSYYSLIARKRECLDTKDAIKIAQSDIEVIGMTTTGAAKLYKLLNEVKPKIVIVEEAAEVLEAHCIAAINQYCEHLILFGDHKQLQPLTSSYSLTKDYQLNISLFERLLNNGIQPSRLSVQYRMRPEISQLITPSIYDFLQDHVSVKHFDHIKGVTKDVFFINHNKNEFPMGSDGFTNKHEAEYLAALADYLVKQGYESKDITIISAYSKQEALLAQECRMRCGLGNICISSIDSYQGKENKIILLSLVRNNNTGRVGFLSTENRVCVALSRAKHGLYIMGNMEILSQSSNLWEKVEEILRKQNRIGQSLELRCKTHGHLTRVSSAEEIDDLKNGGCEELCYELLSCGHLCKYICHSYDEEHKIFQCFAKCISTLPCGHVCTYRCHSLDKNHEKQYSCKGRFTCGHRCRGQKNNPKICRVCKAKDEFEDYNLSETFDNLSIQDRFELCNSYCDNYF